MARLALMALTAVALTRPDKNYHQLCEYCPDWRLNTWQHSVVYDHLIIEWPEKWDLWLPCNLR